MIDEVERKFKSLRTSFLGELKKIPAWRSGQGADEIGTADSSWPFFSLLFFLKDTIALAAKVSTKSNLEPGDEGTTIEVHVVITTFWNY
jgi:hypothetical protein